MGTKELVDLAGRLEEEGMRLADQSAPLVEWDRPLIITPGRICCEATEACQPTFRDELSDPSSGDETSSSNQARTAASSGRWNAPSLESED